MSDDEENAIERRRYVRYSRDLRQRVIHQAENLDYTTTQISIALDMPIREVQRVLKRWRELGEVVADPRRAGRPKKMSDDQIEYVVQLLRDAPDLYMDEIVEELYYIYGLEVSLPTVERAIKEHGLTNKQLSKRAAERSHEKRENFLYEIGEQPADRLVFADETAVNILTSNRKRGWATKGQRAVKVAHFVRGDRYSILPAITLDGIINHSIVKGSFDGDSFLEFIEGTLEKMNPYPQKHSVLVMDNCAIHHVPNVQQLCDDNHVQLIYLPPYSPDFNPIEEYFSSLKSYISRHGVEYRRIVDQGDEELVMQWLSEAVKIVGARNVSGYFRHAGYLAQEEPEITL